MKKIYLLAALVIGNQVNANEDQLKEYTISYQDFLGRDLKRKVSKVTIWETYRKIKNYDCSENEIIVVKKGAELEHPNDLGPEKKKLDPTKETTINVNCDYVQFEGELKIKSSLLLRVKKLLSGVAKVTSTRGKRESEEVVAITSQEILKGLPKPDDFNPKKAASGKKGRKACWSISTNGTCDKGAGRGGRGSDGDSTSVIHGEPGKKGAKGEKGYTSANLALYVLNWEKNSELNVLLKGGKGQQGGPGGKGQDGQNGQHGGDGGEGGKGAGIHHKPAKGGDGGNGGDGGHGGDGGPGGNGGKGGTGGKFFYVSPTQSLLPPTATVWVPGGVGGLGGVGGEPGQGGTGGKKGEGGKGGKKSSMQFVPCAGDLTPANCDNANRGNPGKDGSNGDPGEKGPTGDPGPKGDEGVNGGHRTIQVENLEKIQEIFQIDLENDFEMENSNEVF